MIENKLKILKVRLKLQNFSRIKKKLLNFQCLQLVKLISYPSSNCKTFLLKY